MSFPSSVGRLAISPVVLSFLRKGVTLPCTLLLDPLKPPGPTSTKPFESPVELLFLHPNPIAPCISLPCVPNLLKKEEEDENNS
jgi:hypothetical protein